MKQKNLIGAAMLIWMLASCSDAVKEKTQQADNNAVIKISQTGLEHAPALRDTDSLQIIFYDNPDGDSLRFNRYFTYTDVSDTAAIKLLMHALDTTASLQTAVKKCRSEGKIYVYVKSEPVKTLYYSMRGAECTYIYYIKDGSFVYLPLRAHFRNFLQQQKQKAVKP
jgi:hypothetical protein